MLRSKLNKNAFTLLELLIVIAILAIITTIVIVMLNPTQMIKEANDSRRFSELNSLDKTLSLAVLNNATLGSSSYVYLSLPASQCVGLPALPATWNYSCVLDANVRNIDGTGWIPINFKNLPGGSPLSSLPVDPINTIANGNYYMYTVGSDLKTYELDAMLESTKYRISGSQEKVSSNGLYQTGSVRTASPLDNQANLVGYWKFDEGSGTSALDSSGGGKTGTLQGGFLAGDWVAGKLGKGLSFRGAQYISMTNMVTTSPQEWSVVTWEKIKVGTNQKLVNFNLGSFLHYTTTNRMLMYLNDDYYDYGEKDLKDDQWHHVAFVFKNSTGQKDIYVDAVDVSSPGPNNTSTPSGIPATVNVGENVNGILDDVRVYNRALSAAEIKSIYDATK